MFTQKILGLVGRVGIATFVAALSAGTASAQLLNGSFESPVLGNGEARGFTAGQTIGAWNVLGGGVLLYQTNYTESYPGTTLTFPAQDGFNAVDLTGSFNQGLTSGVSQSVNLVVGQTYRLGFYIGRESGNTGTNHFYDSDAVATVSINGGAAQSFTNSDVTLNSTNWKQFSLLFTPTQTTNLIQFNNGTALNTVNLVGLDNVTLAPVTAAPESGSLALLGTATLPFAMLIYRRRRG